MSTRDAKPRNPETSRHTTNAKKFVVVKKPGRPSALVEVPERVPLDFLEKQVVGAVEVYPAGLFSESLRGNTLAANEEGLLLVMTPNVEFENGSFLVGPVVVMVNAGGMERERAEKVARTLDQYEVVL